MNRDNTCLPSLADHRALRLAMVFWLYAAQGGPSGLFFISIPAWLAANDASPGQVGLIATAAVAPWMFKFGFGMVMDRYTYLPMGRRRIWIAAAQLLMVFGLVGLMIANPDSADFAVLTFGTAAIMAATALQSAAVDGMAIDLIDPDDQGRANSIMYGGYILGYAAAAAFSGWAITALGLPAALLCLGSVLKLITISVVLVRERPGEKLLPWTRGAASAEARAQQLVAWGPVFRDLKAATVRLPVFFCAVAILAQSLLGGLILVSFPLIGTQIAGLSSIDFAALAGISSLLAGAAALLVYVRIIDRVGALRLGIILLLSAAGIALLFALLRPFWILPSVVFSILMFSEILGAGVLIVLSATAMRLSALSVAATQFALLMALQNIGNALGTGLFASLHGAIGHAGVFVAIAVLAGFGAASLAVLLHDSKTAIRPSPGEASANPS